MTPTVVAGGASDAGREFVYRRSAARSGIGLGVLVAILGLAGGAAAAENTIRLDPATSQVANGATFEIKVIQNGTVATSGSSATITFDKAILQVTSVTRGPAFAAAPLFLAGDAAAIAAANKNGKLQNVAVAFFPPGSVPAGEQELIRVGFKAIGCGTVKLTIPTGRVDATMLDGRTATYGANLKITTTGGTVTVCDGAAASAGASAPAAASSDPSLAPGESPIASDAGGLIPPGSIDPNASASAEPAASGSPAPGASAAPSASAIDLGLVGSTGAQSGWLDFALAALAVAAAGLATLIIVLTVIAITGAIVGVIVAIRLWRRYAEKDALAAAVTVTTVESVNPAIPTDVPDGGREDPVADREGVIDPPTRTGIPLPTAQP